MNPNDLHGQLDAARAAEDWARVETLEERLRMAADEDIPWGECEPDGDVRGGATPEEFEKIQALVKLGRECRQVFDDFPEWGELGVADVVLQLRAILTMVKGHTAPRVAVAMSLWETLIDLKTGEMGATREEAGEALELLERRAAVKLEADRKIIEHVEDIARESLGLTPPKSTAPPDPLGDIQRALRSLEAAGFHVDVRLIANRDAIDPA